MNETEKRMEEMTKRFIDDMRGKGELIQDDNLRKNFKCYVSDAELFLSKQDIIRAFEAAVFASGILESQTRLSHEQQL